MTKKEELSELIERYLDGDMTEAERQAFEARMEADPAIMVELVHHKEIRAGIATIGERADLKATLDDIHAEMQEEQLPAQNSAAGKVIPMRSRFYRFTAVAATISIIISVSAVLFYHQTFNQQQESTSYEQLMSAMSELDEKLEGWDDRPAETATPVPTYFGTGFAVSKEGYLVTNYHVVKNARRKISVVIDNDSLVAYKASLIAKDERLDLALLKIEDDRFEAFPKVPFTFSKKGVVLGEEVYTLGYPRMDVVYGEGAISAMTGFEGDTSAYQVSIPLNSGNSGAPILNDKGEVVAIATAKNREQDGASYATRSTHFMEFIETVNNDSITEQPIQLPTRNSIKRKKRTEQLDVLKDFVYIVRVR